MGARVSRPLIQSNSISYYNLVHFFFILLEANIVIIHDDIQITDDELLLHQFMFSKALTVGPCKDRA